MARCKKCPTILRSGNKTGYCSVCKPFLANENIHHSPGVEKNEKGQWGHFFIKIRVEIARAFHVTIHDVEVEGKVSVIAPPHYAVILILKNLFRVPDADIRQHIRIPFLYREASVLYTTDADFKAKYDNAHHALKSIGRDILPRCASDANLTAPQAIHEESNPYVRFTRTPAKPAGSIRTNVIS